MKNLFYLLMMSVFLFSCDLLVDVALAEVDGDTEFTTKSTIETGPNVIDDFNWENTDYSVFDRKKMFTRGDLVIFGQKENPNKLIALNSKTGAIEWEQKSGPIVIDFWGSQIEYNDELYYFEENKLWKLDFKTGDLLLIKDLSSFGKYFAHKIHIVDDVIYFALNEGPCDKNYFVDFYRINLKHEAKLEITPYLQVTSDDFDNLTGDFSKPKIVMNQNGDELAIYSVRVRHQDFSWIDSLGKAQFYSVFAYNITQKKKEWYKHNVNNMYSSIDHVENNRIYSCGSGGIACFDLRNGNTIWEFSMPTAIELYEINKININNDGIFVVGCESIFLLDKENGEIIWELGTVRDGSNGKINDVFYFETNKIIYLSQSGMINIVNTKTKKLKTYNLARKVYSSYKSTISSFTSMTLDGNTVIASDEFKIMAFDISDK